MKNIKNQISDFKNIEARHIYTVSEFNELVKNFLYDKIGWVWVEGEVSGARLNRNNHLYFSLKDNNSLVNCVVWNNVYQNLKYKIEDGLKIVILALPTLWTQRGEFRLQVYKVQPKGIGELELAFKQLKEKLEKEGLFDEKYKVPVPFLPKKIGIITSISGAAIRDMLKIIFERMPRMEVYIFDVKVQGEGAAEEIANAISFFNKKFVVDVLIVGRGGGSIEDLWAFNEEITARAIFASEIPIISAVGHERDFTIADFVADVRAPTPTAAAEIVVPSFIELTQSIFCGISSLFNRIDNILKSHSRNLNSLRQSFSFASPEKRLRFEYENIKNIFKSLTTSLEHSLESKRQELSSISERLDSLSPLNVLKRGYSITLTNEGRIIRDASTVSHNQIIETKLDKGRLKSEVKEIFI